MVIAGVAAVAELAGAELAVVAAGDVAVVAGIVGRVTFDTAARSTEGACDPDRARGSDAIDGVVVGGLDGCDGLGGVESTDAVIAFARHVSPAERKTGWVALFTRTDAVPLATVT